MRYIKLAHFLSLDVVLGAVFFQIFFHLIFLHEWPSMFVMGALASSVGLIYILDRWLDNRLFIASDDRHLFYKQNRRHAFILAGFWLMLGIFCLCYLPISLIRFSVIIGFFVLMYWLVYSLSWFSRVRALKEFCTAFLYSLGIFAPIFSRFHSLDGLLCFYFFALLFIAFQNLYLFTRVDGFLRGLEIWNGLYLIFLTIYLQDVMRVVPFFLTFGIHVALRVFGLSARSRMIGEIAFFSPLLYIIYGIISK